MLPATPKFIFYSDIPPLGNEGVSMSVLAHRIIASVEDHTHAVITRANGRKYPRHDIGKNLKPPTWISWDCSGLGLKFLPNSLRHWTDRRLLYIWAHTVGQRLLPASSHRTNELVGLSGPHWQFLPRLRTLAHALKLPYSVYIIDDYETTAANQGASVGELGRIRNEIKQCLQSAARVFAICPGMAERLQKLYGVSSRLLYPVADTPPTLLPHSSPINHGEIVYIGALGQPYLDSLLQVAEILERHPTKAWRLKIIAQDRKSYVRHFTRFRTVIPCHGCDRVTLRQEVARAEIVLVPYAFASAWQVTAETSFPSKFIDALTSLKPALIFAPDYASISRHLHAANLGFCAHTEEVLIDLLDHRPWANDLGWVTGYQALFSLYHSPSAASAELQKEITSV